MSRNMKMAMIRIIIVAFMIIFAGIFIIANEITDKIPTAAYVSGSGTSVLAVSETVQSIGSVEEPPPEIKEETITLSFAGDCMLASMLGSEAYGTFNALANTEEPEYFFSGVSQLFLNDDFTVVNCENVFTDNTALETVYKNHNPAYWYRSKSANANIFKVGGVDLVSLANNHMNDYGTQGRTDTIAALEAAEVDWGDNEKIVYYEQHGIKIAIICTTMYYNGYEVYINAQIKSAKEENGADYVIVYYHGGTERQYVPDSWRVKAAYSLIDNGADVVLGNHPHVLQPAEEYKEGYIIHSLGNFLFGGSKYPENRTIVYQLTLTVLDGEITAEENTLIPCYVYTDPWRPAIIENEEEISQVLGFMRGEVETPLG